MNSLRRSVQDMLGQNALDWFTRPYLADWIVVGVIYALGWLASGIPPYEREFSHKDESIGHSHHKSQIGGTLNAFVAQAIPLAIIAVTGLIRRSAIDIHHGFVAEISGWLSTPVPYYLIPLPTDISLRGLTHLITEFLKNTVGRLRPDFLARCDWDKKVKACTGKLDKVLDGRRSFPSGHSSGAFAGMTFLALWIAGQTGAWCHRHSGYEGAFRATRLGRFVLSIAPFFWSTYVAITRLEDYRHHKEDVIVGALIGITSASICYHVFFHSPFSVESLYGGPRILYKEEDRYPAGRPRRDEFELTDVEERA